MFKIDTLEKYGIPWFNADLNTYKTIFISHNEFNKFMWQSLKEYYSTGDTGDAKLGIWTKRMRRQNTYFLAVWILEIL